jgi:hypothetical protein
MSLVIEDLVAFLRARLDDDKQTARMAAEPEQWAVLNRQPRPDWYVQHWADPDQTAVVADPESSAYPVAMTPKGMEERDAEARAAHIARHDPARVLADVEAKRGVLQLAAKAQEEAESPDHLVRRPARVMLLALEPVLQHLALAHADHPDYREEWRP